MLGLGLRFSLNMSGCEEVSGADSLGVTDVPFDIIHVLDYFVI